MDIVEARRRECAWECFEEHRYKTCFLFIVGQSLSHVRLFVTPWIAACQASLSFTTSLSLLKLMSIESVMDMSLVGHHYDQPIVIVMSQCLKSLQVS